MASDVRLRRLCDETTRQIVALLAAYSDRPTPELIDALRGRVLSALRLSQSMVGAVPSEPSIEVVEELRDTRPGFPSVMHPRQK